MEVIAGIEESMKKPGVSKLLFMFSFLSRQCSQDLSGHHRGRKLAGLVALSKGILHFG